MLPGIRSELMLGSSTIVYSVNATSVNPWTALGSPTTPGVYRVIVPTGVVISSSGYPTPAMTLAFPVGSTVYLYNSGEIAGAGGAGGGGDQARRDNGNAGTFKGGGGGGGTGRPGGAGGVHAGGGSTTATDGTAGTSSTPGAPGENDNSGSGVASFIMGADPLVGADAIDITTAITLYITNAAGLIVAGGSGGMGGIQTGNLPGGAQDPLSGYAPAGITAAAVESGWAIKYAFGSGTTIVPVSGVNSTRVKGAYVGPTSA